MVPWGTFWLYYALLASNGAMHEARQAQAVALGIGLAWDKDDKARTIYQQVVNRATNPLTGGPDG